MDKFRVNINLNVPKYLRNLGLGFFLFVFSLQTGVGQFNYIPDVIKIAIRESSPPFLALAEVNAEYVDSTIASNTLTTSLKVGLALLPQLELEEILIGELEQVDSRLLYKNENIITSNTKNNFDDDDNGLYPDDLTPKQLSRLKLAQQKYHILDRASLEPQYSEESLGEKIRRLDRDLKSVELREGKKSNVIIKGDDRLARESLAKEASSADSGETRNSSSQSVIINGFETKKTDMPIKKELKSIDRRERVAINIDGLIEFAKKSELVLTPDHRIEVRRFAEGVPQEFGIVRLPESTFNIQFQSSYGSIVAQLINANGIVEGQGVLAVQDLVKSKNPHPTLIIKASPKGNIQVASAYGPSFQKDFQTNLSFNIFGTSDYSQSLAKETYYDSSYVDSEAVIQATARNHVPTTAIISLADGAELMLLPDRMINGLVEILNEQGISLNLQSGDSLIWGQVRKNGKPIEGASIFAERTDSIYLGGLQLPDQLRTTTSENGMFVVVVNEPGWKDLFVQMEDGARLHLNVLTFPGKVAQVFADLPSREIAVSVRSFDAFSGKSARAKVQIQQVEEMIDTGQIGLNVVNVPVTQSISFVNVYPEAPYMDAKLSYTKLLDYMHIPMIRREWLDQVAKYARINSDSNKGVIVGFVQNANYDLIASSPEQAKENLVYFNSGGEVADAGVAGGGFILYNQPLGFVGITIEDRKHQRKFHKITFPENRFVSILNFML